MFANGRKIIKLLDELAPGHLAESWDNVGYLVGNADKEVDRIMVALELTENVLEEAIAENIDLVITHHPLIFKPMKTLTDDSVIGRMVRKLIKHDIGLYAAHTNLDIAWGGTNDYLAELLDLERVGLLTTTHQTDYVKVAVFVPKEEGQVLQKAMGAAGAGKLGNYDTCAFFTEGTGSFRPLEGANPTIGTVGNLEKVEEVRVEMITPAHNASRVVEAMIKAHPYEVPAYDIIPLDNKMDAFGLGRIGFLQTPHTLADLSEKLKDLLDAQAVRYIGNSEDKIRKVGLCTGAGMDYLKAAKKQGCDVYITGDVKYHEAQDALQRKMNVIDGGHFNTEHIYTQRLADLIRRSVERKGYEVAVVTAERIADPFVTV